MNTPKNKHFVFVCKKDEHFYVFVTEKPTTLPLIRVTIDRLIVWTKDLPDDIALDANVFDDLAYRLITQLHTKH
jgi:hypothetical protein